MDPGVGAASDQDGMPVLDAAYQAGLMVIMTVDDGKNDLDRIDQAVSMYKDHPAILMWSLGSEWNIEPLYFGVASSIQDAARRTEKAAKRVKSLDPNHPVVSSYGEIDINE